MEVRVDLEVEGDQMVVLLYVRIVCFLHVNAVQLAVTIHALVQLDAFTAG